MKLNPCCFEASGLKPLVGFPVLKPLVCSSTFVHLSVLKPLVGSPVLNPLVVLKPQIGFSCMIFL